MAEPSEDDPRPRNAPGQRPSQAASRSGATLRGGRARRLTLGRQLLVVALSLAVTWLGAMFGLGCGLFTGWMLATNATVGVLIVAWGLIGWGLSAWLWDGLALLGGAPAILAARSLCPGAVPLIMPASVFGVVALFHGVLLGLALVIVLAPLLVEGGLSLVWKALTGGGQA